MLDLDKLEAEREKATEDKADLFDFYHNNWVAILKELRDYEELRRDLFDRGVEKDLAD
jgi:hypothetical protein